MYTYIFDRIGIQGKSLATETAAGCIAAMNQERPGVLCKMMVGARSRQEEGHCSDVGGTVRG